MANEILISMVLLTNQMSIPTNLKNFIGENDFNIINQVKVMFIINSDNSIIRLSRKAFS